MNRLSLMVSVFALVTTPLGAQRLSLRVAGVETDTAYLAAGDQIPITVLGKTRAGGTVTPPFVQTVGALHCSTTHVVSTTSWRVGTRECWPGDPVNPTHGWFTVEATVSGMRVRDSVYVTSPVFRLGSFGLVAAAGRYDPSRNEFSTYAVPASAAQ